MTVIKVPRPRSVVNPDRTVSSLLLAQVHHMHEAEKRLPLRYRSEVYTNAIKTEGEAAEYIREVTEAIHRAHEHAESRRSKPRRARDGERFAVAAAAEIAPRKKRARAKKATAKGRRK